MNMDGTDVKAITEKGCFDIGGFGQLVYYTDTSQKAFCMLNLVTQEISSFPLKNRGFAQIWNDRVYYQNEDDGEKLYSCALDGSEAAVLLDQKVTGVNVNETGAYCINREDGSTPYLVTVQGKQKLADIKADYITLSDDTLFIYDLKGNMYILDKAGLVTKVTG